MNVIRKLNWGICAVIIITLTLALSGNKVYAIQDSKDNSYIQKKKFLTSLQSVLR